jgi:hypothetical protein
VKLPPVSENDRTLLLEYQRARFAFDVFPSVDEARNAYDKAKENLKGIKEATIAELVRRMFQEWTQVVTADSCDMDMDCARDIVLAEKELYELTFQFGDNIPSESGLIQ